jgi:alanine-synthesizing transaminase
MHELHKSNKLANVLYDIRGPVLTQAKIMEEEGHRILKLNIGNPAPFELNAPDEILQDVIHQLPNAQGYSDSKGIYSARKAVMQYSQQKGIKGVEVDDIYLGNGASELIVMALQGLINNGDEILIPSPDYPLWTGAASLAGGTPIHYRCDEQANWYPDMADIKSKISKQTKALVLINPNNPTGALYPKEVLLELLEIARQHNLVVFSDEIYDKIIFDDAEHIATASLAEDLLIITFNGLSKTYRLAGFRSGWMIVSGAKHKAKDYLEGLDMLASMRLCANVPAQYAIQTSLGGYQSINDLIRPGGRLYEQRMLTYNMINDIPGLSCTLPQGALYSFVKMDTKKFNIKDDEKMVLDLLEQEKILIVHGRAFNWHEPDHFRIVFLPRHDDLKEAIGKIGHFFERYQQ